MRVVCVCMFGGGVVGSQIEAIRHKLILLVKKIDVNCRKDSGCTFVLTGEKLPSASRGAGKTAQR